ncbi:MAG: hypothetical protein FJY79_10635 [Candidatus Aminicenantes bacterium]|jgi:hypothetical protein|nr:hypothetical protein [Candidatus Aminicenantes bacterium]
MKPKSKVPATPVGRPLHEGAPVHIELTRGQFLSLLKAVYLGEHMANGFRTRDEAIQEFSEIAHTLLALAEKLDFSDFVDYDEELKDYFPTKEFEEAMDPLIDDFENETFWEELSYRLALRDLVREFGEKRLKKMPRMKYAQELFERQDKYAEEERTYGLDRLEIVKQEQD